MRLSLSFALLLGSFASVPAAAANCNDRASFLEQGNEGDYAYRPNANSPWIAKDNRSLWCEVHNSETIRPRFKNPYFVIHNRDDSAEGRFLLLKIFRRNESTLANPVMFLERKWTFRNSACKSSTNEDVWRDVVRGANYLKVFSEERDPCDEIQSWYGMAFGDSQLNLADRRWFLEKKPRSIPKDDLENWHLQIIAYSYATSSLKPSLVPNGYADSFVSFRISRHRADRAIVQTLTSGDRENEFEISWSENHKAPQ